MNDEADIRLVDAHAERHGRDHDDAVVLQEDILVARALHGLHAGVIGQRLDAAAAQRIRKLLGLPPRGAIDDAALPAMLADEVGDLLPSAGLGLHCQPQVRPIEAVHEHRRRAAEKLIHNIRARGGVSSRGECHRLYVAEFCLHRAECCVFGAEVVAPLRNAMRLVDRKQRDLGALEEFDGIGFHQALGCNVKKTQVAARDAIGRSPSSRRRRWRN